MRDDEFYYVALDENGDATDFVLAEENYRNLETNMPERFASTVFVKILHKKPEVAPNQVLRWSGWSQKEDENGAKVVTYDWDIQTMSQEECINLWIRIPRQPLLSSSDWTQTLDSPLTEEEKLLWAAYRSELRDMSETYADVEDPAEIVWPIAPGQERQEEPLNQD